VVSARLRLLLPLLATALGASVLGAAPASAAPDPTVNCIPLPTNADQTTALRVYAQTIVDRASPRVLLATFEAAWVESHVNNCANGDLDSVGVFQQRASWGGVDARTTVATATHLFLQRAIAVDGTSGPGVTAGQIAQAVQKSAYPSRYDAAQSQAQSLISNYSVVNGGGTRMIGSAAYMDVSRLGQVYAWNSRYHGGSPSLGADHVTDAKVTAGDLGYWLLAQSGNIYAYGNAPHLGGGASGHVGDLVSLAAMPDGQGYAMLSSTGGVYNYGTSQYYGGSPTGYTGEFVDLETTPTGRGYWLLTAGGQVYAYGDAGYFGGGPTGFSRAIVAMAPTPTGRGYVLVSKAGQVYAYGDARHLGNAPTGAGEITDISSTPGTGYVMINSAGQHYAFGDAPFVGNPANAAPF
jgi:hypothetical protein